MHNDGECTGSIEYSRLMKDINILCQAYFNNIFRLALVQRDENQVYEKGKYRLFFFGGPVPSVVV